jgi:hypothetical protein
VRVLTNIEVVLSQEVLRRAQLVTSPELENKKFRYPIVFLSSPLKRILMQQGEDAVYN